VMQQGTPHREALLGRARIQNLVFYDN